MISIKHISRTKGLQRALLAAGCSVGLLLGAGSGYADQHEQVENPGMSAEQGSTADEKGMQQHQEGMASEQSGVANEQVPVNQDLSPNAQDRLPAEQARQPQVAGEQGQDMQLPAVDHTAKGLIGMTVNNTKGEKVGEITDIGIDMKTEKAAFAVVSVGGVMGIGGTLYQVPLSRLSAAPASDYLTLDIVENDLKSEFSKFEPRDEPTADQ